MPRNPFAFLDTESKDRLLLLLLQVLVKREPSGQVEIDLTEITSLSEGDSLLKYPSDKGDKLVLRFAKKGAEAFFLPDGETSRPEKSRSTVRPAMPRTPMEGEPSYPRHAIHDDVDLALREEEMAATAQASQKERLKRARAEAGLYPWQNRTQ